MIQYEDFSLKIEPKRGDLYPVIVLRSPAGEGRSHFTLPFDPDELGNILADLGEAVRGSPEKVVREAAPGATRTRPQQIGDQLFNALFSGPIRSLLDRSLGMLHGSNQGLRVKLHIDPEDASLAQLSSLPWELMYRKETREFLNLSSFTPILRYLDVQVPCVPLPMEPPLRILGVIANPLDYPQLDLERERRQIEATWARQQDVTVDFLQPATIQQLQEQLAAQPYHALHFMGHGGFDRLSGSGVLLLEDEHGRGAAVDGSTLGVLLRDAPTLRLVFLNACETACVSKQEGLDPFAGVAAAMVMAGIPAVVAMQFPITDGAAIRFANRFYSLLAAGQPVDYAVAQGRQAILAAESGTMEWATPVLFMRAPEGAIFKVSSGQQARRRLIQPAAADDEELAGQLEERYTAGLGAFWLEEWDKAVRCFEDIVAVQPGYGDAAAKLEEARRWQRCDGLYEQAQAAESGRDWDSAIAALTELVAEKADFRDAAQLLTAARRQRQLADLYDQAGRLHKAAKWRAVVNVFAQMRALDPNHADPEGLLLSAQEQVAEQEREAALGDLFGRAVREMDAGRWPEARQLLAQLQAAEPGYREADRLLARAEAKIASQEAARQRGEQIAGLYERATKSAEDGQWALALAALDEIRGLEPGFADPQGIGDRAARVEQQRQAELEDLYGRGTAALEAGEWEQARLQLGQVCERAPGYRETAQLVDRAEAGIAREKAERRRRDQVATLYEQAQSLASTRQWRPALTKVEEILALDPGFADPEGIAGRSREQMAQEEAEAQRQNALAALYAEAVRLLKAGQYQEALETWGQVQARDPGYPDRKDVQATARTKLASLARPAPARRPSARVLAAAGALVLVAAVVAVLWWRGGLGGRRSEPGSTQAPAQGVVAKTNAPALPVQGCGPGVFFCDDFQDGQAGPWDLEPPWRVEQEGDNYYLSGSGHHSANLYNLQGYGWNDYRVESRLRLEQGTINLGFRHTHEPGKGNVRYYLIFSGERLDLKKEVFNEHVSLTAIDDVHLPDRWYTVEINGVGGHLQVFVDGDLKMDFVDAEPLPAGGISFETSTGDARATVDDVFVTEPRR